MIFLISRIYGFKNIQVKSTPCILFLVENKQQLSIRYQSNMYCKLYGLVNMNYFYSPINWWWFVISALEISCEPIFPTEWNHWNNWCMLAIFCSQLCHYSFLANEWMNFDFNYRFVTKLPHGYNVVIRMMFGLRWF